MSNEQDEIQADDQAPNAFHSICSCCDAALHSVNVWKTKISSLFKITSVRMMMDRWTNKWCWMNYKND